MLNIAVFRADAQREDERHGGREAGTSPQAPEGAAHVTRQVVEPAPAPHITGTFLNQDRIPECSLRCSQGIVLRETASTLSLAFERKMQPQLLLQAFLGSTAPEVRHPSIQ